MSGVIETENLVLRPWRAGDAEDYLALAGDAEVSDLAGCERPKSAAEAREFIESTLIPKGCYAITQRDGGRAIGNIALLETIYSRAFDCLRAREAAFSLARSKWGRHIMSEALFALLERGFCELGLDYVCCGYFLDNERCARLARSLGFIPCFEIDSGFVRSDGERPRERICLLTEGRFRSFIERHF